MLSMEQKMLSETGTEGIFTVERANEGIVQNGILGLLFIFVTNIMSQSQNTTSECGSSIVTNLSLAIKGNIIGNCF
jgi:hypothetical protein